MLGGSEVVLAQALPFDPGVLVQQGPLGIIVAVLLWHATRLQDRIDRMIEAHKTEINAERALNAQLQDRRIEDHKVLIPLGSSMVAVTEQTHELVKRSLEK